MANDYVKMIKRMDVRYLSSFMAYFELVLAFAIVLCFKVSNVGMDRKRLETPNDTLPIHLRLCIADFISSSA